MCVRVREKKMSGNQDGFEMGQGEGARAPQAGYVMVIPDLLEGGARRRAPVQVHAMHGQCEFIGSRGGPFVGRVEQARRPASPEGDFAMDNGSRVAQE